MHFKYKIIFEKIISIDSHHNTDVTLLDGEVHQLLIRLLTVLPEWQWSASLFIFHFNRITFEYFILIGFWRINTPFCSCNLHTGLWRSNEILWLNKSSSCWNTTSMAWIVAVLSSCRDTQFAYLAKRYLITYGAKLVVQMYLSFFYCYSRHFFFFLSVL